MGKPFYVIRQFEFYERGGGYWRAWAGQLSTLEEAQSALQQLMVLPAFREVPFQIAECRVVETRGGGSGGS